MGFPLWKWQSSRYKDGLEYGRYIPTLTWTENLKNSSTPPTLSNSSLRLIPTSSWDAGLEDSWSFDSKKKNGEKMYATEYFTFALSEIFIPGDLGVDKRTENQDFVKFIELWACLF